MKKSIIQLSLVLLVAVLCSGCRKGTFPVANTQPPKDAPAYTVESNLTGK